MKTKDGLEVPVVHLGGSAAKILDEGYAEALALLRAAIDGLRHAAPHGRDFPGNEPGFELACQQQGARERKLLIVWEEISQLRAGVREQTRNRRRQA